MKKHLPVIAAAALAVGGLTLASYGQGQTPDQRSSDQMGQSSDQMSQGSQTGQQGTATISADHASQIRDTLAKVTNAAISSNAVDKLENYLSKADRDRFAQGPRSFPELDATVHAFRNDWKSRYGHDFDFSKQAQEVALANCQILPGTMGEAARPAGERYTPQGQSGQTGVSGQASAGGQSVSGSAGMNPSGGSAQSSGQNAQPAGQTMQPSGQSEQMGGQSSVQSTDQRHATVIFPADPQANLPQLTVHLVNEGTVTSDWKIDAPDSLDSQRLSSNLKDHLYALGQQKANWPTNANQAYRATTGHVLAAINDVPAQGGQMQGGQMNQPGPMNQPSPMGGQPDQQGGMNR